MSNIIFWGFVLLCHTQLCFGLTPDFLLRGHSWWVAGQQGKCTRLARLLLGSNILKVKNYACEGKCSDYFRVTGSLFICSWVTPTVLWGHSCLRTQDHFLGPSTLSSLGSRCCAQKHLTILFLQFPGCFLYWGCTQRCSGLIPDSVLRDLLVVLRLCVVWEIALPPVLFHQPEG